MKVWYRRARALPLMTLLKVGAAKLRRAWYYFWLCQRDKDRMTYADPTPVTPLNRYFPAIAIADLQPTARQIAVLTDLYLDHCFDLLGSGWVQVRHGMDCAGVEGYRYADTNQIDPRSSPRTNPANGVESQRILGLIAGDYTPIDWQRDFKSGYRWSEMSWYRHIRFGQLPGVDVKVPWELARAQHLVQLGWAYGLAAAGESDFKPPGVYASEFRNQVLDFIATNPPRFGVNWHSTMDVAIRVTNWLVAYDLFRAYGMIFDDAFVAEFTRSVEQHGLHIIANLDWNPQGRGNHYLANIAGLLFVAAYLPQSAAVDYWLTFAIRELSIEAKAQFNADGSSFEGSTSYHRLSAEMVVYGAALILGLPAEKRAALQRYDHRRSCVPRPLPPAPLDRDLANFPAQAEYAALIEKMAEFTIHVSKPSGHIPQTGDNDSGRFLKLNPVYTRTAGDPDEDMLDHRHLVAAINGLFGRDDFSAFASGASGLESLIVKGLSRRTALPSYRSENTAAKAATIRIGADWESVYQPLAVLQNQNQLEILIEGSGLLEELRTFGYPDFGLYIFRSRRLYLAVRCSPIGQRGRGGHDHNDQLAVELAIDGEDWITDPGTYLYTPFPAWRNKYRSVRAHFAPQPVSLSEPSLDAGLFFLDKPVAGKCLYFGQGGFIGEYRGYRSPVYRSVTLADDRLVIDDSAEGDLPLVRFTRARWPENLPISLKYGHKGSVHDLM